MPTSIFCFLRELSQAVPGGRFFIERVVEMRSFVWAHTILNEAGDEGLSQAHELAVRWAAKCVPFFFFLGLLMFSRTDTRIGVLIGHFCTAVANEDYPLARDKVGHI